MRLPVVIVSVVSLLALPAPALAATVRIEDHTGDLFYRAAPGELNDLRIHAVSEEPSGGREHVTLTIEDSVRVVPQAEGCTRVRAGFVRCELDPPGGWRIQVRLGDRSDRARVTTNFDIGTSLRGGRGSDELRGGSGEDYLIGGPGDDRMFGNAGPDVFREGSRSNGSDFMRGGSGPSGVLPVRDRVDYGLRHRPVDADLAGDGDDGERGERDHIGADVESLIGGSGDDRLTGNRRGNTLSGSRGTDVIAGRDGADSLFADRSGLSAASTDDRLSGGAGSDTLFGSAGANVMQGGAQADSIYAGDGRDTVRARDGAVDQVHCGAGDDVVRSDAFEFVLSCERHDPYSDASPVALELSPDGASVLVGCREGHPAACAGTVQLELGGEAISPEVAFSGANRHRSVVMTGTFEPLPPGATRSSNLVVRIRSHSAAGAPTDQPFPAPILRVG
jgi:hypothetical protein